MKTMKTFAAVLVGAFLMLTSCEDTTIDFDTNLTTAIDTEVKAPENTQSALKSEMLYPFETVKRLYIKDTKKVNDYIDRLDEINVNTITCTFTGMQEDQEVVELNIYIDDIDLDVTVENITNGVSVVLDVNSSLLHSVSDLLMNNQEIEIKINGYSNYAPMTFTTIMDFAVTVTANVLD